MNVLCNPMNLHQGCEINTKSLKVQTQPSRGVHRKRCPENMQPTYRRTPMPKCDFNKVALSLYWNRTSARVFSCKFAAYFQNTFSKKHLWTAASESSHIENVLDKFQYKLISLLISEWKFPFSFLKKASEEWTWEKGTTKF